SETIMRRNSAIRSFTESVDSDFPPAPELPPSLNIDLHYPEENVKKEVKHRRQLLRLILY
ncbi:hypothetical protein WUBG_12603, partial [Wuchereria bancrofti]